MTTATEQQATARAERMRLLVQPVLAPQPRPEPVLPETGAAWRDYAEGWKALVARRGGADFS